MTVKTFNIDVPQGFSSYVTNCGIKDHTLDLGIVFSEVECNAAGVFTKNQFPGEPVKIGKLHLKNQILQAVVVNSKNSNVATGEEGYKKSMQICETFAQQTGIAVDAVLPSSTGVIGRPLPVEKILSALQSIKSKLKKPANIEQFAHAIMTTDTFAKFVSVKVGNAVIAAVAKGSGMIEPNMATMLSYIFTDAKIEKEKLDYLFRRIVDKTFNCLSIDSDTSTSDTAIIMANGLAGEVNLDQFEEGLYQCMLTLTKMLAKDGEGATKVFIVRVINAQNDDEAKRISKSIINSPLVKTAIYKGDPNWGRIIMAVGKTPEVKVIPEKVKIYWNSPPQSYGNDRLQELQKYLIDNAELNLTVDMGLGDGEAIAYGCDLTEEYVKINAYYTT